MCFLKQFKNNEIVYIINDNIIEDCLIKKIIKDINAIYRVGLDMKNVNSINSELFIKYLKSDKYKLYNLQNEVLLYLSLTLKDGKLKSYMNFDDFKFDKRELIVRKFSAA